MESKKAVLHVGNVLVNVSLTTLAALGGAIASPWLAASTTAAFVAKESLGPLIERLRAKQEDVLTLAVPSWWSGDARSWQDACAEVEHRLPAVIEATATQLKKEAQFPTTEAVHRIFVHEISSHLSPFLVGPNNQNLVASYIATPFLKKTATVLKTVVDPLKDDVMANRLDTLAHTLEGIAAAQTTQQAPPLATAAATSSGPDAAGATTAAAKAPSPADLLEQKWQQGAYDVYICYHEADRAKVGEIDARLKAEGILPWFDILTADPAGVLQTEQHQQIGKVRAAAICIGKHAVEDWQALQVQAFLDQFVAHKGKISIIPVFLQDAPENPDMSVFLKLFRGVDFRQKTPDPFAYLLWGITGKRPPLSILEL